MQLYTTIQLGQFHPIFCEDFLYWQQFSDQWLIAGVFDGCSSGRDSHFAASLMGKTLQSICKKMPYWEQVALDFEWSNSTCQSLGLRIQKQLFLEIQKQQNQLLLDIIELMATSILLVCDRSTKKAFISICGDGVFAINETVHQIDQNDHPNYMAYHFNKQVDEWLASECQQFQFQEVKNIAIATDGVLSFAKNGTESVQGMHPCEYLLTDHTFEGQQNMLDKKCIQLSRSYGLKPNDDVAIIRAIL